MYGVKIGSMLVSVSLLLCAGSCTRTHMRASDVDLLSTGLVGWQQIGGQRQAWRFVDGILYAEGGNGGWLATGRPYENFALSLEFRVPAGGESGVFLRAPLEGDPAYTGLEIQILDDYAERPSPPQAYQYTGSLYGLQAPSDRVSREAGQWQKMVIVARGRRIQVGLNGKRIVDTDLSYYAHMADTHPGVVRQSGYLGLQNQGSRVEFRNLRLRELPEK